MAIQIKIWFLPCIKDCILNLLGLVNSIYYKILFFKTLKLLLNLSLTNTINSAVDA